MLELIRFLAGPVSLHSSSRATLTTSTATMVSFSQVCSALEHRLLTLRVAGWDRPSPSSPSSQPSLRDPDAFIFDAARIAALMCMTHFFRQMALRAVLFTTLRRSFRENIESLEALGDAGEGLRVGVDVGVGTGVGELSMRLLLWACCVGGVTALDQHWFALRVHRCMDSLEIEGWGELERCLMEYVWAPKMRDQHLVLLWREVQKFR
jgi:hypothetical protein